MVHWAMRCAPPLKPARRAPPPPQVPLHVPQHQADGGAGGHPPLPQHHPRPRRPVRPPSVNPPPPHTHTSRVHAPSPCFTGAFSERSRGGGSGRDPPSPRHNCARLVIGGGGDGGRACRCRAEGSRACAVKTRGTGGASAGDGGACGPQGAEPQHPEPQRPRRARHPSPCVPGPLFPTTAFPHLANPPNPLPPAPNGNFTATAITAAITAPPSAPPPPRAPTSPPAAQLPRES